MLQLQNNGFSFGKLTKCEGASRRRMLSPRGETDRGRCAVVVDLNSPWPGWWSDPWMWTPAWTGTKTDSCAAGRLCLRGKGPVPPALSTCRSVAETAWQRWRMLSDTRMVMSSTDRLFTQGAIKAEINSLYLQVVSLYRTCTQRSWIGE